MTGTDEMLTVAEAAARLGVSVRTMRRLLSVAEYRGRTQAVERHTSKGVRVTTMLPPDLLADLRAKLHLVNEGQAEARSGGTSEAYAEAVSEASRSVPPNDATESNDATETPNDGNLPAPAYRALIQAQAQTIEAMRSEVDYLRVALTSAQQNLAREQMLRALPAPALEAPPEAPEGTKTGAAVQDGAEDAGADVGASTPARKHTEAKKPLGTWDRFVGWFQNK